MSDLIQFDTDSGSRIARAVRVVEGMYPAAKPLVFSSVADPSRRNDVFRICTFTGAWATGTTKTVTLKYQTATPNTVMAMNLFFPVTPAPTATRDCAIAKEGTAWFLIDVPFRTTTAIFITATATTAYVTDVTVTASFNTANCSISVGRVLATTTVTIIMTTATNTYLALDL